MLSSLHSSRSSRSSLCRSIRSCGQLTHQKELDSILSSFPDGIDFAFGYGSGVFQQTQTQQQQEQQQQNRAQENNVHFPQHLSSASSSASSSSSSSSSLGVNSIDANKNPISSSNTSSGTCIPMIDLILVASDSKSWHAQNLKAHPDHYATVPRILGEGFIETVQEWGAGLYFHPMVSIPIIGTQDTDTTNLRGENSRGHHLIKYGVISRNRLKKDLLEWDSLYCAGRMHKPIVPLTTTTTASDDDEVAEWQRKNLRSALATSLLLQPPPSTDDNTVDLTALFRTIAGLSYTGDPRFAAGAEDPNKVDKLVRSDGQFHRFLTLYRTEMDLLHRSGLLTLDGGDGGCVGVDLRDAATRRALYGRLPPGLRSSAAPYRRAERPDAVDDDGTGPAVRTAVGDGVVSGEVGALVRGLAEIVGPPARVQGLKGVVTAGVYRSVVYAGAKLAKGVLRGVV